MIKPEDTAYGNEKTPAQVIEELRGENERLRYALQHCKKWADHQIPAYAFGDNEAACDMDARLRHINSTCCAVV